MAGRIAGLPTWCRVDRATSVVYRPMMPRFIPSSAQCIALSSFEDRPDAALFNAAFGLLYGTGMYLNEMLLLRPIDVAFAERMRLLISGFRARTLPVPTGAADRLALLLGNESAGTEDASIFQKNGKTIVDMTVLKELKRRSRLFGFPNELGTTDLRIAFARDMAEKATPFEIIAHMMGYRSVNQLQAFLMRSAS
ncbi:hypothetical protein BKD09_27225 [Bradyrhizobium japonicum]|uniref:Tyr recombinase domain-containing protein n=1 Tax=Bradyrhizobium japonicum TaxID=375 RepID=A0A1L3FFE7_BRAJP|nr:hypothetical protein BKD09_27225 [Bradyrhizobium japonicum]